MVSDAHPLVHSDRGLIYKAQFYTRLKTSYEAEYKSRVAHCIDNGPMEGFWGILKREMYYKQRFNDRSFLITAIANYIDYWQQPTTSKETACNDTNEISQEQYTKDKTRQP